MKSCSSPRGLEQVTDAAARHGHRGIGGDVNLQLPQWTTAVDATPALRDDGGNLLSELPGEDFPDHADVVVLSSNGHVDDDTVHNAHCCGCDPERPSA